MPQPANAYSTYDTVGIREDLADLISNISPVDTPFFSSLKEMGANSTKVEWQIDSLAAAAANAHVEGDQESAQALSPTTRVYNYTQIQKKIFLITGTNEAVRKAGRKSEIDYQTAKKAKELAKDCEYAFLRGSFATPEQGSDSVARQMKGLVTWITTNTVNASNAAITEAMMKELLQDVYVSGGNPRIAYTTPAVKAEISEWPNSNTKTYRQLVDDKKIVASVDVYVSDFGTVAIKPHRDFPTGTLVVIDPSYVGGKGTLRANHREQLAKTGDYETWVIRVEHTLRNINEGAHGKITNIA